MTSHNDNIRAAIEAIIRLYIAGDAYPVTTAKLAEELGVAEQTARERALGASKLESGWVTIQPITREYWLPGKYGTRRLDVRIVAWEPTREALVQIIKEVAHG